MNKLIKESAPVTLVIEHQALAQNHIKLSLKSVGFDEIHVVDRAQAAIRALKSQHFDLIVCAFNLNSGSDGFQLFEQIVAEQLLKNVTTLVFLSAELDRPSNQSVIELKPDEFLLKPYNTKEFQNRVVRAVVKKIKFRDVLADIDRQAYNQAIRKINHHLPESSKDQQVYLLRLKGEIITSTRQWKLGEQFYQRVSLQFPLAWARFGYVRCLFYQGRYNQASNLLKEMMLAPQTRLQACEYLAKIERIHQQYDKALDYLKQAANLSPRNIDRLKHVAELARLTHDYESQFEADYAIVRNAKNSIHEKPDIYLAAVRSAIDLGLASLSEDKSSQMALTGQTILASLKKTFTLKEVGEQVDVIQARIYNLKNDKQKAKQLLAHTIEELEDNLDKLNRDNVEYFLDTAKACHEIGFHQHSQKVFDALVKFAGRQTGATLFKRYLIGERALRAKIKESPKELNNRAVEYFRRGNLNGALETFEMAFKVMPKNPTIALNLMQAALENQRGSNQDMVASLVAKCVATVEKVKLNSEQTNRYEKLSELVKRQIAV